ncbi:MAG: DUF4402 domain-containing protein [Bacteroidales bacterium]|jgi:hypothetical protein|nr:DUF4402 domain-containing protein [Bacteroidales bacterium]
MKQIIKFLAIAVVILAFSGAAHAQTVTASSTAAAMIVAPLTINNTVGLHFGTIMRGTALGDVTVETDGDRTSSGGVTLSTIAPVHTVAQFTIQGEAGRAYTITLPAADITITGAGDPMTVGTFLSDPAAGTYVPVGTSTTLSVGATLDVAANQAAGPYTGTFSVSVNYN